MRRTLRRLILALSATLVVLTLWAFIEARSDPIVRRATVAMTSWPKGAPPLRVALMSDIHAGNLAVYPERLTRIVAQVNALHPDLILIAGDFLPGHDPIDAGTATAALAPLKGLHAKLGVLAVPGNHDHWTGLDAVRTALAAAGVRVLANQALVKGPLALGAVDDAYTHHAQTAKVVSAMRRLPGARLIVTHSPDIAPELPPDFPLVLAGHTHCGQVVLPLFGSLDPVSRYADRYRCGIIREGTRTVIVTAGIGGSIPLRLGAPSDLWLLTLGP